MQLSSYLKAILAWCKQLKATPTSKEYQKRRHRLWLERLPVGISIAIVLVLIYFILNLLVVVPALNASGNPERFFSQEKIWLRLYFPFAVQELGLFLCLTVLKTPIAKRYPELIFLGFSWSISLLPQIQATLQGQASIPDVTILFLGQAILIPIQWRYHLISQVGTLGYFVLMSLLGMRDLSVPPSIPYGNVIFLNLADAVLMCFIANVGVYLYESLWKRELEVHQRLEVFLHAVSHDLRNPILGMMMVLKNLRRTSGEEARVSPRILEQMINSSDRQVQLIDTLLEAYATEARGIKLRTHSIDLKVLTDSVIADMQPFLDQVKANVSQHIATELPLLKVDSLQLRRVYENLISNALQYNRPGLNLTLDAQLEGKWMRCTLSDNGVGMSEEQSARVFDLYSRGLTARQTLGLGLGLYICKQIISAHGGTIGVISSPGAGATFWFTLPLATTRMMAR
ncbi:ATP-binding protein [Lyngbya aestuarii]|uniref:ATP-binding protein n=1 Tax=Lyngbya aestuarii TaxID=118322 RepID=UPI00403D650C